MLTRTRQPVKVWTLREDEAPAKPMKFTLRLTRSLALPKKVCEG